MAFGYSQNNPIAVTIKCEVRQKKELVKEIGVTDAPGLVFRCECDALPGELHIRLHARSAGGLQGAVLHAGGRGQLHRERVHSSTGRQRDANASPRERAVTRRAARTVPRGWRFVILVIAVIGGAILLTFKGTPGDCGGNRPIENNPGLAFAYDDRWYDFNTTLTSGLPGHAARHRERGDVARATVPRLASAPIDKVRFLCFTDGGADINGTLATPFGGDIAVRVGGNADLSGQHPKAEITSMRIGGLPAFVTRPFRGLVSGIIDDQLDHVELDHRLTVDLHEGQAVVQGEP